MHGGKDALMQIHHRQITKVLGVVPLLIFLWIRDHELPQHKIKLNRVRTNRLCESKKEEGLSQHDRMCSL